MDYLLTGNTHPEIIALTSWLLHLLASLGISMNIEKSILTVTQILDFIGPTLDSVRAKAYLPMNGFQAMGWLIDHLKNSPQTWLSIWPILLGHMFLHNTIHQTPPPLSADLALNNLYMEQTKYGYCSNDPHQDKGLFDLVEGSSTSVLGHSFPHLTEW